MDHQAQAKPGLTDAELATHPTVFAADALKGMVVVVSGGAGGIGRAIAWLFARLGAHVALPRRALGTVCNRRNADGGRWRSALGRDLDHGEAILFQ
jgi:NAD(P)-dependent dehydrogenase (short-subunit alcohol dehydrogenase family)